VSGQPAPPPATPGQAARAAWNDHWAGPDPYPAGETQEETFERVWGNVAQAVLNDAFPGLKRELAETRRELAEARAERDRYRKWLEAIAECRAGMPYPDAARQALGGDHA
jgi:hypothetical protein